MSESLQGRRHGVTAVNMLSVITIIEISRKQRNGNLYVHVYVPINAP